MAITGEQFTGSKRSSIGDATFLNKNATNNSEPTPEEIDNAVTKAYKAFLLYRNYSGKTKANFLEAIASGIEAQRDSLRPTAIKETHLGDARLNGEITRTINQIKLFAELLKEGSWVNAIIDTAQPERKPLPKPDIRQMQKPIGVVGVFGASNFPFAFSTAGGDTIQRWLQVALLFIKRIPVILHFRNGCTNYN